MRRIPAALAAMVVVLCANSTALATPLRIEAPPNPLIAQLFGVAPAGVSHVTFAADTMPVGFAASTPTAAQTQRGQFEGGFATIGDGTHTIGLSADLDTGVFPSMSAPAPGVPVAGHQDEETRGQGGMLLAVGRRSRRAPGHIYLYARLVAGLPDATVDAALGELAFSLDGWWGLDPLTTSDASNATVLAALNLAATRTAAMREWYMIWSARKRAGWGRAEGAIPDSYVGARRRGGRQTLVTTNWGVQRPDEPRGQVRAWFWRAPGRLWVQPWAAPSCAHLIGGGRHPAPGDPLQARKGALAYALLALPTGQGLLFDDPESLAAAYDLATKPPLEFGSRGTRYEIYFYPQSFRAHAIFLVGRDGTFRTIKVETLDAQGDIMETTRVGIATRIPLARTRLPGGACR